MLGAQSPEPVAYSPELRSRSLQLGARSLDPESLEHEARSPQLRARTLEDKESRRGVSKRMGSYCELAQIPAESECPKKGPFSICFCVSLFLDTHYFGHFCVLDTFGHVWTRLDSFWTLFWTRLDTLGFGHVWTRLDTFGHVWTRLDTFGHAGPKFWTRLDTRASIYFRHVWTRLDTNA